MQDLVSICQTKLGCMHTIWMTSYDQIFYSSFSVTVLLLEEVFDFCRLKMWQWFMLDRHDIFKIVSTIMCCTCATSVSLLCWAKNSTCSGYLALVQAGDRWHKLQSRSTSKLQFFHWMLPQKLSQYFRTKKGTTVPNKGLKKKRKQEGSVSVLLVQIHHRVTS